MQVCVIEELRIFEIFEVIITRIIKKTIDFS